VTANTYSTNDNADAGLSDEQVREYLKQHSDFFQTHPDMLDHLHISHGSGSAVSLVEKQVSVLRERNMEMRKRLNHLTTNARDNDRLYDLTRKLVLQLLAADTLTDLTSAFTHSLEKDFAVEHVSIILFGDPAKSTAQCRIESVDSARIEIGALIRAEASVCGPLRKEELAYLFPAAGDVGSAAVMALHKRADLGVIAVGNSDPNHYSSNMGTLFLGHLAEVLVRLLPGLQNAGVNTDP
jgi:uncharacterized protein YigA (DUF484 family)